MTLRRDFLAFTAGAVAARTVLPLAAKAEGATAPLAGHAARVRVVYLPGLPEKGDVADWIAAGGGWQELEELAEATVDGDGPPTAAAPSTEPSRQLYRPLRTVNPVSYRGLPVPDRRWIVDRWLPIPSVTLLYADGGVGKTQVAQQLMTACATGTPWLGLRVEPCRSFALFCEDDEDELHRRQDAINAAAGVTFGDLEAMRWASGTGEDNVLIRFDRSGAAVMTHRFHDLIGQAKEHRAKLLVIDTAADTFGGSENDRGQVRQFIANALSRAAREIDGAVLVECPAPTMGIHSALRRRAFPMGATGALERLDLPDCLRPGTTPR